MAYDKGAFIVLEGPDCSGKTSLSESLRKASQMLGYEYLYFHPHWPKQARNNIPEYLLGMVEAAAIAAYHGAVVVMDRSWLSECVYATVLRGGLKWPHYARLFSRLDLRFGVTSILCLPSNPIAYRERYGGNIDPDHPYKVDDATLIYEGYQAVAYNVETPHAYFKEAFRPPLTECLDWLHYDLDTELAEPAAYRFLAIAMTKRKSLPSWQLDPSVVNWLGDVTQAEALIAIDGVNNQAMQLGNRVYPLFGYDGYYKLILDALQMAKVPERKLAWVDIDSDRGIPLIRLALAANPDLKVISLDSSPKAFSLLVNPKLFEIRHKNIPCPREWDREPSGSVEAYAKLLMQVLPNQLEDNQDA